jgi:hypothetical protein
VKKTDVGSSDSAAIDTVDGNSGDVEGWVSKDKHSVAFEKQHNGFRP